MNMVPKLKLVIVGHVDHGKSSLIGRMLYDTNSIAPDKMEEIRKASRQVGREVEFAFFLDHLQEEREQGITIDTTQTFFKTAKREFVIIDAPGHVEFVRNMITGASQAEAAILIIDAGEKIQEQTKRHAFILSMLGIEQIIIVVNKMDLVEYRKAVFDDIASNIDDFLKTLNLTPAFSIPVSAIQGDNVANPSSNMKWYQGKTVLEVLESLNPSQDETDKPALFPVQDVYKIEDKRIAVGRLETGKLEKDSEIVILPAGQRTRIKSIENLMEDPQSAVAGESIGVTTKDPVFIERGHVIGSTVLDNVNIGVAESFKASVFWMDKSSLNIGEKLIIRCATQEMSCEVQEILRKLNSASLEFIYENMDSIKNLEVGEVIIKLKRPMVVTAFHELKALGRFVLVKENNICAGGIIRKVL